MPEQSAQAFQQAAQRQQGQQGGNSNTSDKLVVTLRKKHVTVY